jgi:hypothetical protein
MADRTRRLSPEAQAVWQGSCGVVEDHGPPRLGVAAALRAAVEQCRHADRTGFPYITAADLLDIAHELEQHQ